MPVIYFVRHGESEANIANSVNDNPNRQVRLTEHGRAQCLICADQLRSVPFTHAYASEFLRTQESLELLLQHHPLLAPRIDPRLNEWRIGMDGAPVDLFRDVMNLGVEPVEPFTDVVVRMKRFIDDAQKLTDNSLILAVSHKITIVAGLVAAERLPLNEARYQNISNCEIVKIRV